MNQTISAVEGTKIIILIYDESGNYKRKKVIKI